MTDEDVRRNLASMAELARVQESVVLAGITPTSA